MSIRVAIPSNSPGGLEAPLMGHFGKCEVFTVVELEGEEVQNVAILPNLPHEHGGCTAPVDFLAKHGVSVFLAGGMGMRPLQAFGEKHIEVRFTGIEKTVGGAVKAFIDNKLPLFGDNGLCKGGCNH